MTSTIPALGVTTSDRIDSEVRRTARHIAETYGIPYVERTHKSSLGALLGTAAQTLIVLEANAVLLADAQERLRYSQGMAFLRMKRMDDGVRDDLLLRTAELREGETVLDCTLGLAGDAQVAARAVGPSGRVIGLEKSLPLYLWVRYGLKHLERHPQACPLEVRLEDAATFLRAQPAASVDVVLFDPMFGRQRPASQAFSLLRRYADHSELTAQVLADAQRVARRAVVLKGSRYSRDFKKLGIHAEPARPNATVVWAKVPGLSLGRTPC